MKTKKNIGLEQLREQREIIRKKWEESGLLDGFKDSKQLEIEKLEKELKKLKEYNRDIWETYGSELCAGNMIENERVIEREIQKLETIIRWEDAGLLDENGKPIPSKPNLESIKKKYEMNWIIKIEEEKNQRIRVEFEPLLRKINIFGEARVKNNQWTVFSEDSHDMKISLEQLQEKIETVVLEMRKTLIEYENLDKGFTVLKWIGFEDEN